MHAVAAATVVLIEILDSFLQFPRWARDEHKKKQQLHCLRAFLFPLVLPVAIVILHVCEQTREKKREKVKKLQIHSQSLFGWWISFSPSCAQAILPCACIFVCDLLLKSFFVHFINGSYRCGGQWQTQLTRFLYDFISFSLEWYAGMLFSHVKNV